MNTNPTESNSSEEKSIEQETRKELAETYQTLFNLVREKKLSLSDIQLMDQCASQTGIFDSGTRYSEYLDEKETVDIEKRFNWANHRIEEIETILPDNLKTYADSSWAYMMLGNEVSFKEGVLAYWASRIEQQPDVEYEQILGVLSTILYMEAHIPQFEIDSQEPRYLFAGFLSLWIMKISDPKDWKNNLNETNPLQKWYRKIHDIDCCINIQHGINSKILFSLNDIPFSTTIFDLGETDVDSRSLHIELRPTASDTNEYLDINLGGYHVAVPTPEYSLAFKRLQLLQDPNKNNAKEDIAVLEELITNKTDVEKVYNENLPLVSTATNKEDVF